MYDLDRMDAPSIHDPKQVERLSAQEKELRRGAELARAAGNKARADELDKEAQRIRHVLRFGRLAQRNAMKSSLR